VLVDYKLSVCKGCVLLAQNSGETMSKSIQPRAKHGHGLTNWNVSDSQKQERSLAGAGSFLGRSFGEATAKPKKRKGTLHEVIIPQMKALRQQDLWDEKKFQVEYRKNMFIAVIVNDFKRFLELFNSKDESKPRLLNRVELERLERLKTDRKGGISAYAITTKLSKIGLMLEEKAKSQDAVFNPFTVTDEEIFEMGIKINTEWEKAQAEKEQADDDSKDIKLSEVTAETLLENPAIIKEVDNVTLLETAREQAKGTVKGMLTRRINVLK
jgi:hypothetical protein